MFQKDKKCGRSGLLCLYRVTTLDINIRIIRCPICKHGEIEVYVIMKLTRILLLANNRLQVSQASLPYGCKYIVHCTWKGTDYKGNWTLTENIWLWIYNSIVRGCEWLLIILAQSNVKNWVVDYSSNYQL